MTGMIDVGGGMKAIFACGVFDYCLDHGVTFDLHIGVSAGSANLASFLANQRGRSYRFYMEYAMRKEYMSVSNLLRSGSYLDLDYIYGTLSNADGENPVDYEALSRTKGDLLVVATDAGSGKPVYFDRSQVHQDDYRIFMASSALPIACRPYPIDGVLYFDGGLSDPIPVQRALEAGCDKLVVLLSRPKNYWRRAKKDLLPAKLLHHKYPQAAQALRLRYQTYNNQLALARKLEREGKLLILAPESLEGIKTLTRAPEKLQPLYDEGYRAAERIAPFLSLG